VETEGLVEHVLALCPRGLAADIGTGSGAIAIALAVEGRFEKVIATDISPEALATARLNVAAIHPAIAVELRHGSLLEPLRGLQCDVIVSNPPYLTRGECEQTAPEVRDFEPRLALNGGEDGLEPYRVLLSETAPHLRPGGLLALELDSRRAGTVHSMALAAGWPDARVMPDAFGRDRYLLATKPGGTT
jgi:release factor glutamine methyltransferase